MYRFNVDNDIMLGFLSVDDTDDLWRLIDQNRTYLREWLPWLDDTLQPYDVTMQILSTYEQYKTNNGFRFGIWYKGDLGGIIGFESINWLNRSCSIGYWLGGEYQGKGIMTKSCVAMIEIAFDEMKLNRVEIRCAEGNHKSIAIPERLGMVREGVMRDAEWLYDHYVNHIMYSVLAREWRAIEEVEAYGESYHKKSERILMEDVVN